jgi:mannose-1-phosphate guanylyltransferase
VDAVVLVGGEGTRLRPLTLERPKPVLPLLGRPLLAYVLERLADAGVTRVIFGCGYLPDAIQGCFGARAYGVALEYVVEPRPMGTAGGIRHAARGRISETFLALNGDVLADAPLAALVAEHRARGATATISLTPVEDPSRYGLVRTAPDGSVLGFLEKPEPAQIDTNLINAGAYVLEPGVLDLIEDGRAVSIERETFPALVGAGLFALSQPGYWSDVGTPESYIAAHHDLLAGRIHSHLPGLTPGGRWIDDAATVSTEAVLEPPCHIAGGAVVAAAAQIGPGSSVATGAEVEERARLLGAVVQERAHIGEGAVVEAAVVGPRARIGAGAHIESGVVIGPGVVIPVGARVAAGERVFPEGAREASEGDR